MAVERYKDDLIKHLISVLLRANPKGLKRVLKRHQIRDEDLFVKICNSGHIRIDLRYPWERNP